MKLTQTAAFRLSLISSISLLGVIAYGQKLWFYLWIISAFIDLGFIILFIIAIIKSIVFWRKRKTNLPFVPFVINTIFLVAIVLLPLNWIRNKIEFFCYYNDYEKAVKLIENEKRSQKLPEGLQYLSLGGDVEVKNDAQNSSVLFYTFRGVPDGMSGFVKMMGKSKSIEIFYDPKYTQVKSLGDDWYYVNEP